MIVLVYRVIVCVFSKETYRLSFTDNSVQRDNIGVPELCHDGCFLEEFDFIHLTHALLEKLHSNWNVPCPIFPQSSLYGAKLSRSQMAIYPLRNKMFHSCCNACA